MERLKHPPPPHPMLTILTILTILTAILISRSGQWEAFIHVGCLGTSNKSVAVPRQDSMSAGVDVLMICLTLCFSGVSLRL